MGEWPWRRLGAVDRRRAYSYRLFGVEGQLDAAVPLRLNIVFCGADTLHQENHREHHDKTHPWPGVELVDRVSITRWSWSEFMKPTNAIAAGISPPTSFRNVRGPDPVAAVMFEV